MRRAPGRARPRRPRRRSATAAAAAPPRRGPRGARGRSRPPPRGARRRRGASRVERANSDPARGARRPAARRRMPPVSRSRLDDHQRGARDDRAAAMPAAGVDQVDGHGGADVDDADRPAATAGPGVAADHRDPAVGAEAPDLAIAVDDAARAARRGDEPRREAAGVADRARERAVDARAGHADDVHGLDPAQRAGQRRLGTRAPSSRRAPRPAGGRAARARGVPT